MGGQHMSQVSQEQFDALNEQAYADRYASKDKPVMTLDGPDPAMRYQQVLDLVKRADERGESATALRTQAAAYHAQAMAADHQGLEDVWAAADVIATVRQADGGGTWNPVTEQSPACGFCYSPYPEHSQCIRAEDVTLASLNEYAHEHHDLLERDHHFIGLWNDPADGRVYLDVSVNTMDAGEAQDMCEHRDQKAYFDLQTYASVTVNADATSGQGPQEDLSDDHRDAVLSGVSN
jgi:hypothetical protein